METVIATVGMFGLIIATLGGLAGLVFGTPLLVISVIYLYTKEQKP